MNETEIRNMPAGALMNRCVAEEAMGWSEVETPFGVLVWQGDRGVGQHMARESDEDYFDPSMDIASAWEVVEKMKKRGMNIISWHNDMYECVCGTSVASAETAPLAICRAALLAKMKGGD